MLEAARGKWEVGFEVSRLQSFKVSKTRARAGAKATTSS
jgi:hypothetical protein